MQKTKETQVQSLGQGDPLEESMAVTPVFLPGESHGQRSLMVYSQCGRKEWLNTHEKISRFPSVLATKPNPGQSGTALRHCLYGKFIYI